MIDNLLPQGKQFAAEQVMVRSPWHIQCRKERGRPPANGVHTIFGLLLCLFLGLVYTNGLDADWGAYASLCRSKFASLLSQWRKTRSSWPSCGLDSMLHSHSVPLDLSTAALRESLGTQNYFLLMEHPLYLYGSAMPKSSPWSAFGCHPLTVYVHITRLGS